MNIFSNKASIVLRRMLGEADKKWQTADFISEGISLGMASMVLNKAEDYGYVTRVKSGKTSYSIISNKEAILKDWQAFYRFDKNPCVWFQYSDKNFLKNCINIIQELGVSYSLTLYSASRLISPYVKDDKTYIYLDIKKDEALNVIRVLKDRLLLNRLVSGGNVCFAIPFYNESVFKDSRKIGKYNVVSNLQLYLDLMGYPPTGVEEAIHLKAHWQKVGEAIA